MTLSQIPPVESWQTQLDRARRLRESGYGSEAAHHRLLPNPELPLGETAVYTTVAITSLPQVATAPQEIVQPVDVLSAGTQPADGPAEGVLLTHEQAWRSKGVTLGKLLHSMSLAPGEVTQVAVSGWHRTTQGESAAETNERERAAQSAGRQREIHDVTKAVAHETTFGSSSSTTSSSEQDVGVGGILGFLAGAGGARSTNTAFSSSVGFNTGSRSLSADSNQAVHQQTQQQASNARSRRAAVVQEVSESETEQFKTRVVANYNHTHTLNMMYYEVLQVYELATRVVDAQRCIFLPMTVMPFTQPTIVDFSRPLARATRAMGRVSLAEAIEQIDHDEQKKLGRINRLLGLIARLENGSITRSETGAITGSEIGVNGWKQARSERQAKLGEFEAAMREEIAAHQQRMEAFEREQRERLNRQPNDLHPLERMEQERVANETRESLFNERQALDRTLGFGRQEQAEAIADISAAIASLESQIADLRIELNNAQDAIIHVPDDVTHQLNSQQLLFNQALWAQLEPTQVAAMLAGKQHDGLSLAATVDPNPIAVEGHFVGFRWNFPAQRAAQAAAFRAQHLHDDDAVIERRDTVVIPTGGVFAEAVPGRANSAEKLDLSRFWKWDEDTIPILPTAIAKLHQQRHAQRAEVRPGGLDAATVKLQALPIAPAAPAHQLASILGTSVFRDMSGSELIPGLLEAAQKAPAATSAKMQALAQDNISAFLDFAEDMAPKVGELLQTQGKKGSHGNEQGKLDASDIGGLQNELGEESEGLDIGELAGEAAELGLFL